MRLVVSVMIVALVLALGTLEIYAARHLPDDRATGVVESLSPFSPSEW